ncbi:hypothetical protein SAMN02745229_01405 [Butyrivibrio fibrisolvens DSM 3071]|uniref:Uncharacterized protein n=1 Tax=Butyrivibrio fibrisolvens DSM 3071 TaxID=1121131 RepID=A0A1M5XZW5_BUTFI|nr:DUF6033 family protein [Butyrivibrio fibrisolvens]SHI04813.1 hypothetical protein SAMN02745229_01405 [Butyrivibrio fibrisolvens DSM 3071]
MKIVGAYDPYVINSGEISRKKSNSVKDYSNYLTQKYGCLTPGPNSAVSITGGLLRKAMADEKTGAWLERELSKAPDYIKEAQQSAKARGSTLKSVSIEFGEEYTTMCVCTVTDGGGTDSKIDKWLEKLKEKKAEQKKAEKRLEKEQKVMESQEDLYSMELQGKDLEDLTKQFSRKLSEKMVVNPNGSFDVRA